MKVVRVWCGVSEGVVCACGCGVSEGVVGVGVV